MIFIKFIKQDKSSLLSIVTLLRMLLLAFFLLQCRAMASGSPVMDAVLLEVTDGDTIVVELNGKRQRVRYLLIDTPELHHPERGEEEFGREAKDENIRLLGNSPLKLEMDVQQKDKYGRLLAYVYAVDKNGKWFMVNEELVRRGCGMIMSIAPNVRYIDRMIESQKYAQKNERGFWGIMASPAREYTPEELVENAYILKGKWLRVRMTIQDVKKTKGPVLLMGKESRFSVVIFDEGADAMKSAGMDLQKLKGKELVIGGKLQIYRKKPEMIVSSPIQIEEMK